MFSFSTRRLAFSLVVAGTSLFAGNVASFAAEPGDVVAKVGNSEITEADIAYAAQDLGSDLQRFPPAQWRSILLDVLVDMKLLAQAAKAEQLDQDEDFKRQMEFLRLKALRNAYLSKKVDDAIEDADLQAAYDEEYSDYVGDEEVNASHILVKEEDEAKAIIKQLDEGADFAELAKEKSTGPSGPNGGSLGFFTKGQMVPPFEEAAFALESGDFTKEPVQTQFGWHVIKVDDKRVQEKPSLEDVSAELRQGLIRERYAEILEKLKTENPVEILEGEKSEESTAN